MHGSYNNKEKYQVCVAAVCLRHAVVITDYVKRGVIYTADLIVLDSALWIPRDFDHTT
jgi:hypothetical protein